MSLGAWWNGYEVVAATSEEEAREVLALASKTGELGYEVEDLDGDGWRRLPDDRHFLDEDGDRDPQSVGEIVQAAGKPCHLWSCEP